MAKKDQKSLQVADQELIEKADLERTRERQCFVPKTDIYETEDSIVVVADIPGVNRESVEITLEKDVLSIDAYSSASENQGLAVTYSEYMSGDFHRKFRLTREIDRDKIEAVVADGVLELRLPKADEARTKRIAIKAG